METQTIIVIFVILILYTYSTIWGGKAPKPYNTRKPTARKWKKEFPDIENDEIRKFLLLFAYAFAFKPKYKFQFEPSDRIADIYNALYPLKGADSMELETLAIDIEKEYPVDFDHIWNENLTLGELFRYVMNAQKDTHTKPTVESPQD